MQMHFGFGTIRFVAYHDPMDHWSVRAEIGSCDDGSIRWWGLQMGRTFAIVEWSAPAAAAASA